MPTLAFEILEWLDTHRDVASRDKCAMLSQIPEWQWKGEHWGELSRHCSNHHAAGVERRPGNALNVEIGAPLPRCLFRDCDGKGLSRFFADGNALTYGLCEKSHCFHCGLE